MIVTIEVRLISCNKFSFRKRAQLQRSRVSGS